MAAFGPWLAFRLRYQMFALKVKTDIDIGRRKPVNSFADVLARFLPLFGLVSARRNCTIRGGGTNGPSELGFRPNDRSDHVFWDGVFASNAICGGPHPLCTQPRRAVDHTSAGSVNSAVDGRDPGGQGCAPCGIRNVNAAARDHNRRVEK